MNGRARLVGRVCSWQDALMANRSKKTRPKRTKPPPAAEPGPVAAQNVILEQMQGHITAVIEAVTMTRDALRGEIRDVKHELSSRMDVLEFAVRRNSADIQSLAEKLDAKADTTRVATLEQRVEALELPVG